MSRTVRRIYVSRTPGLVYTLTGLLDMTRRIRSTPRPEPERIVLWLEP
jgi:hypothetical protein